MTGLSIIIILIVIIVCILVSIYANYHNKLTDIVIKINETESIIDNVLRDKYDILNRSISLIKGNIELDSETFNQLIKLRSRKISNFELDRILTSAYNEFLSIKSKYPELEDSDEINKITKTLEDDNQKIENLKLYYNDNITGYNKIIKSFPTNIIASINKYKEKPFFDGKDMFDDDVEDFKL